ncbi:Prenyltransferase/squalene oxidase [Corchorus olitorius]|uniref:Prenyltransferase/squalene oxidase n=1 Tax=Corchorus olitorius TaxID=93759 RepID=A0A1R3GIJ0_9ROSI|nr:Prenyltransferase/squalene oxidase [Corchorus olitorius]
MWKLKVAEGGPLLSTVNNHVGRQHWEFDPDAGTPVERDEIERLRLEFKKNRFKVKQSSDLLMRMQLTKENPSGPIPEAVKLNEKQVVTEEAITITLRRAISFYSSIQAHDGHWPAESAGPLFFLPPLVMALYVTGGLNAILSPEHQKEIIRYIYNHQNEDGGWGLHIEGHSTMFGTALSYITLRLLGEGPEDGEDMAVSRGRKWILDHGGLVAIPSWGKFWVTVLGVYEWAGCNPMPPEFWLLPKFLPVHPARNTVAKEDLYYPHPLIQDVTWGFLHHVAEPMLARWPFSSLREKALKVAIQHVHYEDENSRYLTIGCVEKVLCLMACWVEDPNSEAYKRHLARLPDYYWVAEDGLKMQAIMSSNLCDEYGTTLRKAHDFVKASQVRENPSGNFSAMYRHISKGAWTFSMQDHGWQVSDCTAEGLKCALLYSQMPDDLVGEKMETERFYDAVNVILSLQSKNGGFPAWEPQRAYSWLEVYTNLEGNRANLVHTAWALLSLIAAGQADVDPAPIHRGIKVLINTQMEDGDFPQQEITGVFMRNCTLNYSSYRNIFPIWALGEYRRRVLFA